MVDDANKSKTDVAPPAKGGDTTDGATVLHAPPGPSARVEQAKVMDPAKIAASSVTEVEKGTIPRLGVNIAAGDKLDTSVKLAAVNSDAAVPPLTIKTAPDAPSDKSPAPAVSDAKSDKSPAPAVSDAKSDKSPAPAVSDAPVKQLTPEQQLAIASEQRKVGTFYQTQRLLPFLEAITPKPPVKDGEDAKQAQQDWQKLVDQRKQDIIKEAAQGDPGKWQWGPASQAAFKDYLDSMQNNTFPRLVRGLESLGQTEAPGGPGTLPIENGARMSPEQYKSEIIAGQRALDMQINPAQPPMKAEAIKIESAVEWMGRTNTQLQDAELRRSDAQIGQLITDRKLPQGWQYQEGQDKAAWRQAAKSMIELTLKVGREISISDKLNLPLTYPPGTEVSKDKDGRLIVNLNLPKDLRLDDPANVTKVRQLAEFESHAQPQIDKAVKKFEADQKNPVAAVGWGDMNVPQFKDASGQEHPTQGIFEAAGKDDKGNALPGKLVSFVQAYQKDDGSWLKADGSAYVPPAGQTLKPLNLLEQRPTVETQINGDVKVDFKTQAQDVPWYGYQNMLFVKNVGQAADLQPITYKPDDIVAVNNGGSTEFMLAKDLKSNFEMESSLFYGQKILSTTMDAAMLATGTVELAAAVKGATLLAAGAEAAGTELAAMSAQKVAWYAGKGLFDAALGGLDPDNAYFASTDAGRKAISIHSGLFVAAASPAAFEVVKGLSLGARSALGLGEAVDAAKLAQSQADALEFQNLVQKSGAGFALTADWAGKVMGYAQIPMAPMVGKGLIGDAMEMYNGMADPYAAYKAVVEFETAAKTPGAAAPPTIPAPEVKADKPEDATRIVQGYKEMFADALAKGSPQAAQIDGIFDKLNKAIQPGANPQEVEALKRELANNIAFSPDQVKMMEFVYRPKLTEQQVADLQDPEKLKNWPDPITKARTEYVLENKKPGEPKTLTAADVELINQRMVGAALTTQNLHDLMDAEKRKDFPDGAVKARANIFLAEKDPDLVAASEVALLYLGRQQGDKPSAPVAAQDIAPNVSIGLDQQLLASDLKRNLDITSHDGRGIVSGDILTKTGAIRPEQFGAILQDVLKSDTATPEAKMHALSDASGARIGAVIAGMFVQESQLANDKSLTQDQKDQISARNFGVTAKDLEGTLATAAASDPDANVRAMSAGLLYGLQKLKFAPEEGVKFLDQLTSLKQGEYDKRQGSFAQDVTKSLEQELASSKADNFPQRMAAIDSLSALAKQSKDSSGSTKDDGAAIRHQINQALADSLAVANLPQANKLFEEITPQRLKQMSTDDPGLAIQIRVTTATLLKAPPTNYNPTYEKQLLALTKKVPALADGASAPLQQMLYGALKNVLTGSSPSYYDLRSATIDSIGSLGDKSTASIPLLRQLAGADPYGAVRESAVSALEKLHDPGLSDLLAQLLKNEGDPAVAQRIRDVQYRVSSAQDTASLYKDTTKDILNFQSEIKTRYPQLQKFDDKAQQAWVLSTFPLLDKDNFVKELTAGSKDKLNNWFFGTTNQFGDELASRRDEQFKALAALAQGDAASPQTQQARQFLYSIIASHGSTVDTSDPSIYIGQSINWMPREEAPFAPVDDDTVAKYYQEKQTDWTSQAAQALADTATNANSGRDLSARLISLALSSGVKGQAQATLLNAWRTLNPDGKRIVSEALYQYVLSTAN